MLTHREVGHKMIKRLSTIVGVGLLALLIFGAVPAWANTIASSTMWFQGSLTYDSTTGSYTGTIKAIKGYYYVTGGPGAAISTGGGFDVYAKAGGTAYVQGNTPPTETIGPNHDAYSEGGLWGTWYNPDVADWDQYSLQLTANHWYLRYSTGESPMSGTMDWATLFAAETDVGTDITTSHGGSAAHGGGAQAWDVDWGWGVEVIPLQFPGFQVAIMDLGGGQYRMALVPLGDPSGDGSTDVIDVRVCLQVALGFVALTNELKADCDVNGDGQVTLEDAQIFAQISIGVPINKISGFAALDSGSKALARGGLPASGLLLMSLLFIPIRRKRGLLMKWLRKRAIFVAPLLLGVGLLLTACSSGISTSALIFSHTSLAQTGYGTLTLGVSGMPNGGLASIEVKNGGMTFDPSLFIVTGIKGLHGFTVLASVIDNNTGKVSFAVVNPSGGATGGAIVQFSLAQKGIGSSTVKIDGSKLVLGDANNQSISTSSVNVGSEAISIP